MSRRVPRTSIDGITVEVLTDIIARVGESEPTDIGDAPVTCKRFLLAGDTKEVFSRVALDFLPYESLAKEDSMFLEKCFQAKNPETIFRKGMILYFTLGDKASGVTQLRRVVDKGHLPAAYAMGMIKISKGLPTSNEGCDLLNALYASVGNGREFLFNVEGVIRRMLHHIQLHHDVAFTTQHWIVNFPTHTLQRILSVGLRLDDELLACRFCKWYSHFHWMVRIFEER